MVFIVLISQFIFFPYEISSSYHSVFFLFFISYPFFFILLCVIQTFGTIPWQSFFQRVLSMQSAVQAQVLSITGAFFAIILVIPAVIIGAAGTSASE